MARPVEYDLEQVLDNAMEIFWQKGYEGVSMAELVSYTGLNRRTMYSLFKDKDGIFKDALDNYNMKLMKKQFKLLEDNPGKKGIELFFDFFKFDNEYKGCLLSNSIREKKFMNENTYTMPKEFFGKVELGFEKSLLQAKEMGEFSGDVRAMSLTIITLIHGFHVHGIYNSSKEDSKAIIKNILNMIQ